MQTLYLIEEVKNFSKVAKEKKETIGLVPTMGFLHEGHLTLIKRAKAECDKIIATIFVNPMQFGAGEDLERYPKAIERDLKLLREIDVDAAFLPTVKEMYPDNFQTFVEVTEVSKYLCGSSRPSHFRGVTTVVAKLFNIVEADKAYFGLKDAQQLQVICKMVKDLNMRVEIVPVPIVREQDGLAMSSRNSYLTPAERQAAVVLVKSLQEARLLLESGERRVEIIRDEMLAVVNAEPLARLDYLEVVNFETMQQVHKVEGNTLIAMAVWIGSTRLIDNLLWGDKDVSYNV